MNEKINCTEAICAAHNFAVIGHPIAHTMSPFIHTKLFALGNGYPAADYGVIDLPPEELTASMPRLREFSGFNITIPHKQAIIPFLKQMDQKASLYQSVNTVKNNGCLEGYTTDPDGFLSALGQAGIPLKGRVVILGTGGVARTIAYEAGGAPEKPEPRRLSFRSASQRCAQRRYGNLPFRLPFRPH